MHVASLGSIEEPMTTAVRTAFWIQVRARLDKLVNRTGDDQVKILDAVHARIPMVTMDEQRTLQRENAEADKKFWETFEGLADAEGHKELAEVAARAAADVEARAKDAAGKAVAATNRIDRLDKGEPLTGGLGKPKVLTKQDFMKAGFTESDLRHCGDVAELCDLLGERALKWLSEGVVKATDRWRRATVRRMVRRARQLSPP